MSLVGLRSSLYSFQSTLFLIWLMGEKLRRIELVDCHVTRCYSIADSAVFPPGFLSFFFSPLKGWLFLRPGVFIRAWPRFLPFLSFSLSLFLLLPSHLCFSLLLERSQRYAFWNLVSSQFEIRAAFIGRGLLSCFKKYADGVCVCVCACWFKTLL